MRFFHFKNLGDSEAFVFAKDAERARELFIAHGESLGGDTDSLLWRELEPDHFHEPFRRYLEDGLKLNREGIADWDGESGWSPVMPQGWCE